MRHLLISAAALLLAAPALAQPKPNDPSQIRGKGGFGQYQQQQAQQQQRPAPNGGPTTLTNQMPTGSPPPGGGDLRGDRGGDRGGDRRGPQAQPAPPPPQQAAAPQARDNRQGGNRGGNNSRTDNRPDNNRSSWDNNNRGWDSNRGRNDNVRNGSNGRRNWSSYGNYHRDWRPTRRFRAQTYHRPSGWYSHRWTFGEFLPRLFWARDYWLDYRIYDLPPPPYGAVWVRVADDALLIDQDSGEVITVAYNVFY